MTVFPEPVLVGGENFDQWLKEHRASHVRMGIAEPCVCAGCVYARRLERGPVTRYLDTVAAERTKSDWTPPSKHPLSGFTLAFDDVDLHDRMIAQLRQMELDRRIVGEILRVAEKAGVPARYVRP